jgi:hypothetical protein
VADPPATFDERLLVPVWWVVPAFGVAALLGVEVHIGYPAVWPWLGYVITVPLAAVALIMLSRTSVHLTPEELQVGPARLPLRHVGAVEVIPPADKQQTLGPDYDPAAYLLHRAWIKPLVRVELTDPGDPTPYWIFSVRHADELAAKLRQAAQSRQM